MPVYHDAQKGRYRFTFNRIVNGHRHRASRLLPKDWNRTRAEAYARKEEGRLYSLASGVEQQQFLIDDAVALYVKHKIPKQTSGHKAALHLAALLEYYEGRNIADLAIVAREAADADHGWSTGTIHNRLAYLKAACRYAWKKHWLPAKLMQHNPADLNSQKSLRILKKFFILQFSGTELFRGAVFNEHY